LFGRGAQGHSLTQPSVSGRFVDPLRPKDAVQEAAMSMVGVALTVPQIVLVLFGGVLSDRSSDAG
jgi:hypothetical protein